MATVARVTPVIAPAAFTAIICASGQYVALAQPSIAVSHPALDTHMVGVPSVMKITKRVRPLLVLKALAAASSAASVLV